MRRVLASMAASRAACCSRLSSATPGDCGQGPRGGDRCAEPHGERLVGLVPALPCKPRKAVCEQPGERDRADGAQGYAVPHVATGLHPLRTVMGAAGPKVEARRRRLLQGEAVVRVGLEVGVLVGAVQVVGGPDHPEEGYGDAERDPAAKITSCIHERCAGPSLPSIPCVWCRLQDLNLRPPDYKPQL